MRREEVSARLEVEWQDRLARQAASGQSIAAFCRSEGVTEGTFYGWRSRLGLKDSKLNSAEPEIRIPMPFIELGPMKSAIKSNESAVASKNDSPAIPLSSLELRLELGNGVVLQITRR